MTRGLADETGTPTAAALAEDPERAAYDIIAKQDTPDAKTLAVLALVREVQGLRRDLRAQRTPPSMPVKRP